MHMTVFGLLLALQAAAPQLADTGTAMRSIAPAVESMLRAQHRFEAKPVGPMAVDTPQEIIEYSDAYGTRLKIHRLTSYTLLPLFAFQYAAGRKLYDESADAPDWATKGHGIAATALAGVFTVNTITGVWNLAEARKDPEGRTRRTVHSVLMMAATGGFVATGLLAEKAERNPDTRKLHRNIAISSMAVATISYAIMLPALFGD